MTPEHILALADWYEQRLIGAGIPKKRIDTRKSFGEVARLEILAHAHYLCDGIKAYSQNPEQWDKTNRHLTAIQMCLSFANWYTLDELMDHNKHLPPGSIVDRKA